MFDSKERYEMYEILEQFFQKEYHRLNGVIDKTIEDYRSPSPKLEGEFPKLTGRYKYEDLIKRLQGALKMMKECEKSAYRIKTVMKIFQVYDPELISDAGEWLKEKIKIT